MTALQLLSDAEITQFRQDGYLALQQIAPPEEVGQLREIFDRLFGGGAGWDKGAQYDLAGTDENRTPARLPQILDPAQFAPELRETQFRNNALTIAKQLLGRDTELWFEHAILKPAQYGAPTPWHQDEAHRDDPGTAYEQISIWMPLQEATPENGCMQYIPRSHLGEILEHRSPNNDPRITALECVGGFDANAARACPLPPGGAAIHHCRTLHGAGPNLSDQPRRAYILAFRGPARPAPEFRGYPWNASKHTAAQERRESWQKRGGPLGRAGRNMAGVLRHTARRVGGRLKRLLQLN